ncbi:MAG: hypothetical protein Q7V15_11680 [Phenylobacterium sp.]|uniref:hypothetical protein n=1 Tax=Phenylobacterium sp. TaxID=1871053 RepID=UPI0027205F3B|nr:hypothetical protein [Phenylobacterium sp.]MDO8902005.1 hypothetical protein [Phenylobacterium sp.]
MLAAEPVTRSDDLLLTRVRAAVAGDQVTTEVNVSDFFASARTLELLTILDCADPDQPKWRRVRAAGHPEAAIVVSELSEWMESAGGCKVGDVLVAHGVFGSGDVWITAAGNPPRPVYAAGGAFSRDELMTHLRLTGPEQISVVQAFAWFGDGQVAASEM